MIEYDAGKGLVMNDPRSESFNGWIMLLLRYEALEQRVFLGNIKNSVLRMCTLRYLHDIQVKMSNKYLNKCVQS